MVKELKLEFYRTLLKLEGKECLECMIAYEAAPTIKNKKPSSLITFTKRGKNLMSLWNQYGKEVTAQFGIEYFVLKETSDRVTVLFFKRRMLESCLQNKRNTSFMTHFGYDDSLTLPQKLQLLKSRYTELCPHEIGIFLGIPVEEVEGFIKNSGNDFLLCRYWKVYCNVKRSELLFQIYDDAKHGVINELLRLG